MREGERERIFAEDAHLRVHFGGHTRCLAGRRQEESGGWDRAIHCVRVSERTGILKGDSNLSECVGWLVRIQSGLWSERVVHSHL